MLQLGKVLTPQVGALGAFFWAWNTSSCIKRRRTSVELSRRGRCVSLPTREPYQWGVSWWKTPQLLTGFFWSVLCSLALSVRCPGLETHCHFLSLWSPRSGCLAFWRPALMRLCLWSMLGCCLRQWHLRPRSTGKGSLRFRWHLGGQGGSEMLAVCWEVCCSAAWHQKWTTWTTEHSQVGRRESRLAVRCRFEDSPTFVNRACGSGKCVGGFRSSYGRGSGERRGGSLIFVGIAPHYMRGPTEV